MRFPGLNIGVATGPVSRLVVIDLDVKNDGEGWRSIEKLQQELGHLPRTLEVETPSGGRHWYLRHPEGPAIGRRPRCLPGIDLLAGDGYAVAVWSTTVMGVYRPLNDAPVTLLPPAWTEWAHDLKKDCAESQQFMAPASPFTQPAKPGYGASALRGEVEKIGAAVPGTRNVTLNGAAFALGQLVAAGVLGLSEVTEALITAARSVGLADFEITSTLQSGLRAGMTKPRGQVSQ